MKQSNDMSLSRVGNIFTWVHPDGKTIMGTIDMAKVPGIADALACGPMADYLIARGISESVTNAAALSVTDKDGNIIPASIRWATKRERMAKRIAGFLAGTVGRVSPQVLADNALLAALQSLATRSATAKDAVERFATMPAGERDKFRAAPSVRAEMERLARERAPGGDEMLDDLEQA